MRELKRKNKESLAERERESSTLEIFGSLGAMHDACMDERNMSFICDFLSFFSP